MRTDDCLDDNGGGGGGVGSDLNKLKAGGNRKGKGVNNFLHESPSHKLH